MCSERFVNDSRCCVFPDKWYGVTMQSNWQFWKGGRVVELNLYNNGLKGAVPDAVGNLTALVKLNLGWNSGITGEFVRIDIGIPPFYI